MRLSIHLGLLVTVAACERADRIAPTDPPLPVADHETPAPEPIDEHRAPVEHPPPLPPGAAWFRRLTRGEQANVDWVCRNERADPCWGPVGLRAFTPAETARYATVKDLVGREMERHCTQLYGPRRGCNTPLVISFDGAPVTFTHDGRTFAFRGARVASDWPAATTPWLALDRNGDGVIDRGSELFGDGVPGARNGFDALAALDANHDGRIDASDPAFASLVLWADRDGDRRSTPDELTPLAGVVTAIPLASRLDPRCDDAGNCEGERGTAMVRDGSTAAVVDVYLPER
jgi:hypothetical protein